MTHLYSTSHPCLATRTAAELGYLVLLLLLLLPCLWSAACTPARKHHQCSIMAEDVTAAVTARLPSAPCR
jgi:hypothetical protein